MDPKYLGKNQQDSSRIPHSISPGYYYFAEQARGAGYMDPEFRRHQHGYVRNDYFHHHPHHPQDMHEAIRREIEKERIREEIIMSEIVRRRVLEAEVRRELMMEKEMALRRGKDGFPSGSSPVMGLESPIKPSFSVTRAEGWPAEERLGMSLEDREKLKGRIENGGSKTSPFQTGATDLRISEVKTASKGNKEKERILLLTKPEENVSGSKRKAVTPPEVVNIELPANVIGNKKSKEEWSCALCEVSATSEKGLNDHLLGKKHKSKEAALRAQRAGKNYSIGLFPKKAIRSNPVVWTIDPEEEEGVKLEAQSLFYEKAGKATTKDDLPLLENPKSELLKITQAEVIQKVHENEDDPMKKGFKFWCEMCHVGTLSRKVMNTHKWGKKHVSRLRRQREQNGGTGSFNQKKSVVLVDPVKEVSENGKIENLEKFNKALDEASSEDHTLLDVVKHEEQEGKTLNSENINKALDEASSEDHTLLDVVKHEEQEGSENINKAFDEVSSEDHTILDVIKHEEQEGKTLNSENINKALDELRSKDHELLDTVEQEDHKRVDIIMEEASESGYYKPRCWTEPIEDEPGDEKLANCSVISIAKPQV